MSAELRVLAVDDERCELDDIARLLREHPDVGEVCTAESGAAALQALTRIPVDAVFLDVRMPDIDGVEVARVVSQFQSPPAIVFVSAYESAAIAAFELSAADYILKPIARQRLCQALKRITSSSPGSRPGDGHAMIDQPEIDLGSAVLAVYRARGDGVHLLPRSSILYLEAYGDYQRVFSTEGRFLIHASLIDLERKWGGYGFVRVHRKFIVNLRHARTVQQNPTGTWTVTFSEGSEVPIARRHLRELLRSLQP